MSGETNEVVWRGVRPVSGIRGIWPARNSLRINESKFQAGTDETMLYTVPAGKLLFIGSAFMEARDNAAEDSAGALALFNDGDVFQFQFIVVAFRDVGQFAVPMSYSPAIEAPADWEVRMQTAGVNMKATGFFFGWLEDA